jgi:Copper type II ascorbate-dependent monooxygenase, C-terminal domain
MKIYITTELRPYDGGVMVAGQIQLGIPPRQQDIVKTGYCTTGCGSPRSPVNITRLFLHMHSLGNGQVTVFMLLLADWQMLTFFLHTKLMRSLAQFVVSDLSQAKTTHLG